jgi:hypothetical protein
LRGCREAGAASRRAMATRSSRVAPAAGRSGSYGGSVASARRLSGTPRAAALAPPRVDADGYLDFVPRAALEGAGIGSGGNFPGAVPERGGGRGIAAQPSRPSKQRDDAGDGAGGGGSLPALRKPVRVDPTKEKPYTAKFITERKAGERLSAASPSAVASV